jgi:hypothetical protein
MCIAPAGCHGPGPLDIVSLRPAERTKPNEGPRAQDLNNLLAICPIELVRVSIWHWAIKK